MEQIDWSKAPEGATHWEPESEEFYASFMRRNGAVWECFWGGGWVDARLEEGDGRENRLIPKPTTWNGEGLPPVGTVCEFLWNYRREGSEYVTARVVAHDEGRAILRVVDEGEWHGHLHESSGGYCGQSASRHPVFRPIRTPEQIAAEEREKALNEMVSSSGWAAPITRLQAAELYAAGYRKVDPSK